MIYEDKTTIEGNIVQFIVRDESIYVFVNGSVDPIDADETTKLKVAMAAGKMWKRFIAGQPSGAWFQCVPARPELERLYRRLGWVDAKCLGLCYEKP